MIGGEFEEPIRTFRKVRFLAITFQPVDRLNSNFEFGKICRIGGLFDKAVCRSKVVSLSEKWVNLGDNLLYTTA